MKRDLEKLLDINIVLDESAIDDSLTEEELVNVRLKNLSYANGLRHLLRVFNATYTIQHGIVRIISLDNVDDPDKHSRAMLDVQQTLDLIKKYDGRMNSPQHDQINKSAIPEIVLSDTIMSMVQTDAWRDNDKGEAVLTIAGGILIVRGPSYLLGEVKDFVQDLHANLEARTH